MIGLQGNIGKMVNKTNKGNRYELEARKMLKKQGYLVEKKNSSRWESNDFWGMFDILALKVDRLEVRLIQVKSNKSDFYKSRKEIERWMIENDVRSTKRFTCEVWLREPRKAWVCEKVKPQNQI